jgi:hypothetical protein
MRRTLLLLAAVASASLAPISATPAGAGGIPALVYTGGSNLARTATAGGSDVTEVSNLEVFASIGDGVLVGSRPTTSGQRDNVVGFDGATGTKLFTLKDGRFPLAAGGAVVFQPDFNGAGAGDRDPTVNSLWYYDIGIAATHRLVQFHGGERAPLHTAISPNGRRVAAAEGNDVDLFVSDIWVMRTDVHKVTRLTRNGRSWYPSFSPGGTKIAFMSKNGVHGCSASIRVMDSDGTHNHLVRGGSCHNELLRPVWLDAGTLVAWRWTQAGGPRGLVTIDVATGDQAPLVTGSVVDFSVSRTLGAIVYRLADDSVAIYDVGGATTTPVPGGIDLPGGKVFMEGALELAY